MTRATPTPDTASDIVAIAEASLPTLLARTDAAPDENLGTAYLDRNVSDVLAHLHAWNVLLEGWLAAESAGDTPVVPTPYHTWDDLRALNDDLYAQHAHRPYAEVRDLLVNSRARVCALVAEVDDDRLFDADARPWLGGFTLASVIHETLGNHDAWAHGVLDEAGL